MRQTNTLNALTVDVEDFFHVEALASTIARPDWEKIPPRVERNVESTLEILADAGVHGTFFILGWVARTFPGLVRAIAAAGHEIGSHGHGHQRIRNLTRDQFRSDIVTARDLLADQVQRPVIAYRAPSFSIVAGTLWGLDILVEEGFRIDSSIFPVRHDLYGIPGAERFPHWRRTASGGTVFEFPPSTVHFLGNDLGVGGGGYLRLLPYAWTRRGLTQINEKEKQPAMVYFHPWEIDPGQPRYRAPMRSRFRHYTNLSRMEGKIRRLMRDFRFDTVSSVCAGLDVYQEPQKLNAERAEGAEKIPKRL
jgi:polysaccharide deacetylase family protein (PEP-CTERM system associated)